MSATDAGTGATIAQKSSDASIRPARAQIHADKVLSCSRQGVDFTEERFEVMMGCIRGDVARGLSPAQIAHGRAAQFQVCPSSIYRWIAKGYGGMAQIDLRRQVGYKPRKHPSKVKPTSHGKERSYAAFLSLGEERCAQAAEMDCVMGKSSDTKCILTLYVRPCKFQFAILLPEKTSSAVACALDMLESVFGKECFQQMFGLILTDNGAEFADSAALERSCEGKARRCRVYYCDVRQSQQKGGCERNHVELRKIIPKGRGISFDALEEKDMGTLMSHLNSEPRPSLANMTPLAMLKAAFGPAANHALEDPDDPRRLVIHTDRGGHYRGAMWMKKLEGLGITRSMSRKDNSGDNAACEGFFSRMKTDKYQ